MVKFSIYLNRHVFVMCNLNCTNNILKDFKLFFREDLYSLHIIFLSDDSYKISSIIFSEKKKYLRMLSDAVVIDALISIHIE